MSRKDQALAGLRQANSELKAQKEEQESSCKQQTQHNTRLKADVERKETALQHMKARAGTFGHGERGKYLRKKGDCQYLSLPSRDESKSDSYSPVYSPQDTLSQRIAVLEQEIREKDSAVAQLKQRRNSVSAVPLERAVASALTEAVAAKAGKSVYPGKISAASPNGGGISLYEARGFFAPIAFQRVFPPLVKRVFQGLRSVVLNQM